ncbi:MAG: peptidylprolyl isomerase [Phycisphaerales bacterium]|nr:peptidylprolyl isomerase [Phycisphaerales bacterium]
MMINTPLRPLVLGVCVALLGLCSAARAQLTADHLYFGLGRRVPINVIAPEDYPGELTIKIYDAATLVEIGSAPAARGRVGLASLFPALWELDVPKRVLLAQLYLDETATGAPLVIQPLVTPNYAINVDPATMQYSEDREAKPAFEDDRLPVLHARGRVDSPDREVTFSGYRIYVEQEVVVDTTMGEIVFRMRPDAAPNTVFNFLHLVEGGFYSDVIFHRVVAKLKDGRPFVIQVGDPSGTGSGGPGYMVDLEKSDLRHDFGVLSMARASDPNSNGSQVFVCLSREGTAFLDGRYTAFAQAVSGAEVIRKIAAVPVGPEDRPFDPPMITRASTRDAPPIPDRAPALGQGTASATEEVLPER